MQLLLFMALLAAPTDGSPANDALAKQVGTLVGQLDASQLSDRDSAERELEALGSEILPLLPPIGDRTSAEAAQRLTRLRQVLMRAQAKLAAEPTHVTLQGRGLPLDQVLAEISKQTGNQITDHRAAFGQQADARQVDVDFDKTPFWKALDNVLDQADLTLYGFAGEPGLFVINRSPGAAPRAVKASYAGVFRLEPVRFEAQRDLRNVEHGGLRLFIEVSWEPRLQPFSILQPLSEIKATGNTGEAIPTASQQAELETLIRRGFSTAELDVPFVLPPRGTSSVQRLNGKMVALVPGPLEEFRFEELPIAKRAAPPKAITMRKAGTSLTLDTVRTNNEIWEASLRIRFEAPSAALESHRGWMLENQAYFLDSEAKRHDSGGLEQTLQNRDEIGLNYFFDLPAAPDGMTFVYRTPLMVLEIPVEYELFDLPLP
jgi:hypothetical protein